MNIKFIEIKGPELARIHGNLSRTPLNQLRRKLGASVRITRLLEDNTGMCRYRGVDYDFWLNEWGDIVTVKSA